jgi:anti-anti-sigma factor
MARAWSLERTSEGIAVRGEIDLAGADDFVEEFCVAARDAPRPLIVDLTGVTFIDSSGVGALFRIAAVFRTREIVIRPSHQVIRVLDLVGLAPACANVAVLPAD